MKTLTTSPRVKTMATLLLFVLFFLLPSLACSLPFFADMENLRDQEEHRKMEEAAKPPEITLAPNNPGMVPVNPELLRLADTPTPDPALKATITPTSTPGKKLSSDMVFTGKVTLTFYYQVTCVTEGQATLTLKSDGTLLLSVLGPSVSPRDCAPEGSKIGFDIKGTYDATSHTLSFTSSYASITEGTGIFSDKEASGTAVTIDEYKGVRTKQEEVVFKLARP